MSMTLDQFNRRKTSLVKRLESGLAKQFNAESFYLSVRAIPAWDDNSRYDWGVEFHNPHPSDDYDGDEVMWYIYDRLDAWYPHSIPEVEELHI